MLINILWLLSVIENIYKNIFPSLVNALDYDLIIFFFIATLFIYLFLFLAVLGFRFVRGLSLVTASGGHSLSRCGTALHRSARAFHYRGPSRWGAQAPDAQAQ